MTKYYSLCVFDGDQWHLEFGDYEREVVEDERDEHDGKTAVLVSGDTSEEIGEAFAKRFNQPNPLAKPEPAPTPKQAFKAAFGIARQHIQPKGNGQHGGFEIKIPVNGCELLFSEYCGEVEIIRAGRKRNATWFREVAFAQLRLRKEYGMNSQNDDDFPFHVVKSHFEGSKKLGFKLP